MGDYSPLQYEVALLYSEAANQPQEAKLAVLDSVYNRMASGKSYLAGKNVVETIMKSKQYAVNSPRFRKALTGMAESDPDYIDALAAVQAYHGGARPSITGVTHFHSYKNEFTPYWAKKLRRLGKIGDMWFFREE